MAKLYIVRVLDIESCFIILIIFLSLFQVFDVLPLYGCLKPTESQQFQFTFYGHSRIMAEATAVCRVKGGPDYEVHLKGEASVMDYEFSEKNIDFGKQVRSI